MLIMRGADRGDLSFALEPLQATKAFFPTHKVVDLVEIDRSAVPFQCVGDLLLGFRIVLCPDLGGDDHTFPVLSQTFTQQLFRSAIHR